MGGGARPGAPSCTFPRPCLQSPEETVINRPYLPHNNLGHAIVPALLAAGVLALVLAATSDLLSMTQALLAYGVALTLGLCTLLLSHRAADRRARKNELLGELSSEVNRAILLNEDEGRIFSTILNYAFRMLENVNLGSILAFDETGGLVIIASQGFSPDFVKGFRLRLEDTFQYRQSGGNICEAMIIKPEIIRSHAEKLDSTNMEYKSIISAPLFVGGKLYGFLNMDSLQTRCFDPEDLDLLKRFASQIEVSLLARERYRTSLAESRVDGLTGFLARSYFEQIFEHSIEHAKRYGESFALGMFDVDRLKVVNDSLGHPAGDRILAAAAAAIRSTARKSDALGRYGGDEFIALCFSSDAKAMGERAERTLAELRANPIDFGGRELAVSFSYGFANYPEDSDNLAGLVSVADAHLYAMKALRKKLQPPSLG